MNVGLKDYVKEAFSARPAGMFIPPNWVGLGIFGLLGFLNPGLWILGAGLELGYLYLLTTNSRFQRVVRGRRLHDARLDSRKKTEAVVAGLPDGDKRRYRALEQRCQAILEHQRSLEASPDIETQHEGLGRLLHIFLRLLLTRDSIRKVLDPPAGATADREPLDKRIARLERQLKDESLGEDLRRSLAAQLEILQQRVLGQREASAKLGVVDAELSRIEEQVELIREQAMLASDPAVVSQRIDQIAATLGGTTQWIREQQQIYGKVGDMLEEPPPIPLRDPVKEGP